MTEKFTEERYRQIVDEATEHDKVISDGVYIEAAIRNPLTREYAYADYVDHDVSVLVEDGQPFYTECLVIISSGETAKSDFIPNISMTARVCLKFQIAISSGPNIQTITTPLQHQSI